jgi:hypothetical protein
VGTVAPSGSFGPPRPGAQRGGIGEGGEGRFCEDRATAHGCAGRVGHARCTPACGVNEEGASRARDWAETAEGPSSASRLMFKRWAPSNVFRPTWC